MQTGKPGEKVCAPAGLERTVPNTRADRAKIRIGISMQRLPAKRLLQRSLGAAPCAKLHSSRETGLPCDVNSRSRVPRPRTRHDPDKSMPLRATNAKRVCA